MKGQNLEFKFNCIVLKACHNQWRAFLLFVTLLQRSLRNWLPYEDNMNDLLVPTMVITASSLFPMKKAFKVKYENKA